MPLTSPRLRNDRRLDRAARNSPAMGLWDDDHNAVATVQRALADLGFDMSHSIRPDGSVDGIYGPETREVVARFQMANDLSVDGIMGQNTLAALDQELQRSGATAASGLRFSYMVPGHKPVLEQPTSKSCWATTYTILKSWKDGTSYEIEDALAHVGPHWVEKFRRNEPLAHEHAFLRDAGLRTEPQASFPIEGWAQMLRRHGLCYVALVMPRGGQNYVGHALVVEGITGDGTPYGTRVSIIDPGRGSRGTGPFATVEALYSRRGRAEGPSGDIQIGHF